MSYLEHPTSTAPELTQTPPAGRVGRVGPAIVRALAATVALTAAWGVLSGATKYHFVYACLLVGVALARVITLGGARQRWLPVLAGALAFSVGFFGDVLAVALVLVWHDGVPAGTVLDNFGDVFRNVASGHSAMDWVFFILAAVIAGGLTAARQATGTDPLAERVRAARSRRGEAEPRT